MKNIVSARFRLILVGAFIATAAGVWLTNASAWANPLGATDTSVAGIVPVFADESGDGSNIQYGYSIDIQTRFADAGVTYDYLTKEGVTEYAAFNRTALQRLTASAKEDSTLATLVTFTRPLAEAEFEAFVSQYHIQVKSYTIWVDNKDGTTTTILGAPSDTELVPRLILENILTDVTARGGQEFLGWVDVNGNIPVSDLKQLADNDRVFLVDVTEALIREKFTDAVMEKAGIPRAVRERVLGEELQIRRPPLAWQVRELGLGTTTP